MKTVIPQHILDRIKFKKVKKGETEAYPEVVGIVHESKPCEDCGRTVKGRVVEYKLNQYPERHWKEHCVNCKRWRNPDSGKFELDNKALNSQIVQAYRRKS